MEKLKPVKKDPEISLAKRVQSIICFTIVIAIIILTFIFRDEIENYASAGYIGLFIGCVASTATILLPAPGIMVVVQYAQILNPLVSVLIGALGTAIGECTGYLLGRYGNEIGNINTNRKLFNLLRKRNGLAVVLASMIPFPVFDFVGVCAGILKINIIKFVTLCFIGKAIKLGVYVSLADLLGQLMIK